MSGPVCTVWSVDLLFMARCCPDPSCAASPFPGGPAIVAEHALAGPGAPRPRRGPRTAQDPPSGTTGQPRTPVGGHGTEGADRDRRWRPVPSRPMVAVQPCWSGGPAGIMGAAGLVPVGASPPSAARRQVDRRAKTTGRFEMIERVSGGRRHIGSLAVGTSGAGVRVPDRGGRELGVPSRTGGSALAAGAAMTPRCCR